MKPSIDDIESELLVQNENAQLTLTLNRPNSANSLSPTLVEAMLDALAQPEDAKMLVIRSNGKHFCAGFDLSDIENVSDGDLLWRFLRIEKLLQIVYHYPIPSVVVGQGQIVGAGADLFAACWQRLAFADAQFKMPGWQFELALGTRRFGSLVGNETAIDMLIDTRILQHTHAQENGLVNRIVTTDTIETQLNYLLQRCKSLSPAAMRKMLSLLKIDTRDSDIVAIVDTAGKPGLKQRILKYREKAIHSKRKQYA